MKTFLITIIFFLGLSNLYAYEYIDVVYLKDGSVVKGIIIEQVPNEKIKIEISGGSIFVYNMSDIEKIVKEKNNDDIHRNSPLNNQNQAQIDFNNIVFSGGITSNDFKFKSGELGDAFYGSADLEPYNGYNICIEYQFSSGFRLGGGIIRKGAVITENLDDYYYGYYGAESYEYEWILDYYTGYGLLPVLNYSVQKSTLEILMGFQIGKIYDGRINADYTSDYYGSESMSMGLGHILDEFNLDYGLILGADYWFNKKIGIRGSYYLGLNTVLDTSDEDNLSFTNRGYSVDLLISTDIFSINKNISGI